MKKIKSSLVKKTIANITKADGGMAPHEAARKAEYGTAPKRGYVGFGGVVQPKMGHRRRQQSKSRNKITKKTLAGAPVRKG